MALKNFVKKIGLSSGIDIRRVSNRHLYRPVSLKTAQAFQGNVLLSYRTTPFIKSGKLETKQHNSAWEITQIAKTFLDLGYGVDVIYWLDNHFVPKKDYKVFIDVHSNLERISPLLNNDCIKILHIVWAHWLFHNYAEMKRLLELRDRRNIVLKPFRQLSPSRGIEFADFATILGNEFTMSTYSYAQKPMFRIPASTVAVYAWPEKKDFEACRRSFLWFGGGGMVHKGLDLVLEAFSELPEYHLTVCGPLDYEKAFVNAYYKELYKTPNIRSIGWVDVNSVDFVEITNNCIGLVHPSCSEGQSGSVVNCLHAGLIPIISRESGIDINDDFGIVLRDCSIDEIKQVVKNVSSLSSKELKTMARQAWEFAGANHTKERFSEEYRGAIEKILDLHRSRS
jgi:glycosyltransferase involved in cell wall biosynthesis